ncbi:MAG: 4Fe-4S binding protein [Desulfomicrobium escambiense]|nr:4Fe-4S binding protein [Desulfomicrobium escambiense]
MGATLFAVDPARAAATSALARSAAWANSTWRRCALKKNESRKYRDPRAPAHRSARRPSSSASSSISCSGRPLHGRGLHRLDRPALLPLRPAAGPGHDRLGPRSSTATSPSPSSPCVATVLFGRVFCGWVCPLGAVHQFSSFAFKRTEVPQAAARGQGQPGPASTTSSSLVLAGALFGLDLAGYLDPLSFLTRSMSVAACPRLAQALSSLNGALYGLGVTGLARVDLPGPGRTGPSTRPSSRASRSGLFFLGCDRPQRPQGAVLVPLSLPGRAPCSACSAAGTCSSSRIDDEKCIKCGLCTQHCETQARAVPERQVEERRVRLLPELRLDLPDRGHPLPGSRPGPRS